MTSMKEDGAVSTPPTAPQVHATGLGRAEIRTGEAVITPISDRLFALAFHLCVRAGEYIPRDELVSLFWGDRERSKGRHSLRQMLYRLRQLEIPIVDAGDAVHLPEAAVTCDVRAVLREGWEREAPEDLVRAGGELLAGGPQSYSETYRDWYDGLEARVRTQLRRAALRFLGAAKREGRWGAVEEWALHVLRHDALNEEATLALAESMVMTGSKARALEVLDGYLAELGDRAERIGLPAKVLRKRIAAVSEARPAGLDAPIFGREKETRQLTAMLTETASGHPRSYFLHGPAGIGKTRLLTDTRSIAALQGFSTIMLTRHVNGPGSHTSSPFTIELCKAAEQLPGAAAADPLAMSVVRRTIHGTASELSPLPGSISQTASDTYSSIAALLIASADDTPVCVMIDDAHLIAGSDAAALLETIGATSKSRVCWLLSARHNELLQDYADANALRQIAVSPVDSNSATALARDFCERCGIDCAPQRLAHILSISGGNPLLLQTLILSAAAEHSASDEDSLERALTLYLSSLPSKSIEFLEAVAFLQPHATVARVTKACGTSPRVALPALTALTRCGILRSESDHHLYVHDAWSSTLRSQRTSTELSALALCCAQVLFEDTAFSSNYSAPLHSAHLFCQGGDSATAHHAFRSSATLAARTGQYRTAKSILCEAQAAIRESTASHTLLPDLGLFAYLAGDLEEAVDYTGAVLSAEHNDSGLSTDQVLTSAAINADSLWKLNRPFQHRLSTLCALLSAGNASAHAFSTAALFALRLGLVEQTHTTAQSVMGLLEAHSAQHGDSVLAALCQLIFSSEIGERTATTAAIDRLTALTDSHLPAHTRLLSVRYRLIANRYLGLLEEVEALAGQGIALSVESGMPSEAFQICISAGFAFLDAEVIVRARAWLSQALNYAASFSSAERQRALLYGMARLDVLDGKYASALTRYDFLFDDPTIDFMPRRRALELALCSFCLAEQGALERAHHLASVAEQIILSTSSNQQLDAAAEHLLGALEKTSTPDHCRDFGSSYLSIRDARGRRYIPVGFRRLRAVASACYAASETPDLRSTAP